MSDTTQQQLIDLTQPLLDRIAGGDWETYARLCDPSLSAFEPEARRQRVDGISFLSGCLPSTRDRQGVTGDVSRLLGGEKQHRIGHLAGLPQTAQRRHPVRAVVHRVVQVA